MQIILVRHGKPEKFDKKITVNQLQDWVQQYNSAELDSACKPSSSLLEIAKQSYIIASDLKRSVRSAQLLCDTPSSAVIHSGHSIYREIDLPNLRFPSPKMSPRTWIAFLRILWLFGLSKQCESFQSVKKRAKFAVSQLEQAAQQHDSVMLIGHGLFNRFIAKVLLQQKWFGPASLGNQYWDYAVFKKQAG